jgi:glycerol-3-phosphate acyltransferase PlsX
MNSWAGLEAVCEVIHTTEVVIGEMKPHQALRERQSSMRLALEAVAEGRAQAAISAGNTGAYLALSRLILKPIAGIDRPAIASQMPTLRGECVMLDLGGSLTASAKNLVDYAVMGDIFARYVLGVTAPTIGLLNVGREASKGNEVLQEAYAILKTMPLNFYGFIEGDDIGAGTVDVVVTDGFTGNVALKTGEGLVKLLLSSLRKIFSSSWYGQFLGLLAKPFFQELKGHFDPRHYNGHGGTDGVGFAHALEMAHDMIATPIHKIILEAVSPDFSLGAQSA